jgi:RNA polymerase sigma-70 factor (ECF subfamily)
LRWTPLPEASMGVLRRLQPRQAAVATGAAAAGDPQLALIQRVGRGDQAAFSDMYDSVAPLVHGVVLKIVRDPSQAEEVVQEVFVELWRVAPRFDPARGTVTSWVATIAHRRAVDRVRSEQAARNRVEREATRVERPHDEVADSVVAVDETQFERRRVRRALDRLTSMQREAVELAYFGGHTYREVAVLLGVPEGTIKTRIRDGMIRLRDELGAPA